MNLGVDFEVPKAQGKDLAYCVGQVITVQHKSLIGYPKTINPLARRYTRRIIHGQSSVIDERERIAPDYARLFLTRRKAKVFFFQSTTSIRSLGACKTTV